MIEHVFVLMLENRSFDHLLGFSRIEGTDPSGNPTKLEGLTGGESNPSLAGGSVTVSSPADFLMDYGPGHEFIDVEEQICGKGGTYCSPAPPPGQEDPNINNRGYVSSFSHYNRKNPESIMKCFSPDQLPVLTTLAKEFAVCDHWFSSLPGPTWPNRFFVHAASSGGLDDSPSFSREFKSILYDGFKFDNGTIYDQLDNHKLDWMIYTGDEFPQALSIYGMRARFDKNFRPYNRFKQDVNDPQFEKSYVFLEPDYHAFTGKFRGGTSQHPNDDITSGEKLLKEVYESVRGSPLWEKSLLIVTYDEHGGFYDHVVPPATVHPGDSVSSPGNNHNNFDFQQLGVRVPTIVISPLIAKGTIDHGTYDHASVLATAENLFKLGSLTKRDGTAQNLSHLFKLKTPRTEAPLTLPNPASSGYVHKEDSDRSISFRLAEFMEEFVSLFRPKPVDPSLRGFHHIALLRDIQGSSDTQKEEIARRFVSHQAVHATKYMRRVRRRAMAQVAKD